MAENNHVTPAQIAGLALTLVDGATIKADEQSVAAVNLVRTLLTGIRDGRFVVTAVPEPPKEPAPKGKAK